MASPMPVLSPSSLVLKREKIVKLFQTSLAPLSMTETSNIASLHFPYLNLPSVEYA
jgi:hypothetical protein